jgi:hypothetical protein
MQAGESYYTPPPPLPASIVVPTQAPPPAPMPHWMIPQPGSSAIPMLLSNGAPPPGPPPALVPPSKSLSRSRSSKRSLSAREPATISGFKDLQSLAVLDIDNLDIVSELRTCMKQSSSTLTELQLSLSDSLAIQARKPPPDSEPEDSDVEDEFQVVPASQNTSYDATGPAKAFRAQEERKIQEAVLGRIFDVEPILSKKPHMRQRTDEKEAGDSKKEPDDATGDSSRDPREEFVASMKRASVKLMALSNGSRDLSISQQDILDMIEKAARKYVASGDLPTASGDDGTNTPGAGDMTGGANAAPEGSEQGNESVASSQSTVVPGPVESSQQTDNALEFTGSCSSSQDESSGTFSLPIRGSRRDAQPEDIDIAQPVVSEDALDDSNELQQENIIVDVEEFSHQPSVAGAAVSEQVTTPSNNQDVSVALGAALSEFSDYRSQLDGLLSRIHYVQSQAEVVGHRIYDIQNASAGSGSGNDDLKPQLEEVETQLQSFTRSISTMQSQIKADADKEGSQARKHQRYDDGQSKAERNRMQEYVRDTRGFLLESLSIHLIPVKASVLSRAIDLRCLKQLTLLNVGNQAPIWTLLGKENKTNALPLRSVFTDNVSNAFLGCMSQLEELHELFLLERGPKHKPESFAPRSSTTIDQIRRLVLKKHMMTLKRLMIKDESSGPGWDANEKTMILICSRGIRLEELAVSMNIHAVHAFMQYFSGLVSLRAINILHFRNNDTCIWVMREILRFIVDNLSHHPELKLEWIAMEDDRVDRVVRPSEGPESSSDATQERHKAKSKGKQPATMGGDSAFPWLPVEGLDSESESEDDGFDCGTRLRFKTVGPLQFYDVWGVKIFEKEIRSGRL